MRVVGPGVGVKPLVGESHPRTSRHTLLYPGPRAPTSRPSDVSWDPSWVVRTVLNRSVQTRVFRGQSPAFLS